MGLIDHHTAPRYAPELWTVGQNHLKGRYHRVEPINSLYYLTLGWGAKTGRERIEINERSLKMCCSCGYRREMVYILGQKEQVLNVDNNTVHVCKRDFWQPYHLQYVQHSNLILKKSNKTTDELLILPESQRFSRKKSKMYIISVGLRPSLYVITYIMWRRGRHVHHDLEDYLGLD